MISKKEVVERIIRKKNLPRNYTNEVGDILKAISFDLDGVQVLGSMSFRSILYASDYDCYEVVNMNSVNAIAKKYMDLMKSLIKQKNIFIGDIKIGQVDEWEVIDEFEHISDYDYDEVERKIKELYKNKIISKAEYDKANNLIIKNPNEKQFIEIKKELRFHILRWTPQEIIKGKKQFRGKTITLQDAMTSKGLFKMDVIARLDNGVIQEFSIIYELRVRNRRINFKRIDFISSIGEAITNYIEKGSWFKVCKRLFSLYNYKLQFTKTNKDKNIDMIYKLFQILNSDLGILYQIHGDIDVLIYLIENHNNVNINHLKQEIDGFIGRLSNVYSSSLFLKNEPSILNNIRKMLEMKNKDKMKNGLEQIDDKIMSILNTETKVFMDKMDIL